MKTILSIVGVIMLLMAGSIGYLYRSLDNQELNMGGVNVGSEYKSSQATGEIATSTLFQHTSTFGGIVITEDFAGALVFYDATSTAAVSNAYSERLADFPSASTEGVYMFDIALKYDLVMVSDDGFSFAGDITILYR